MRYYLVHPKGLVVRRAVDGAVLPDDNDVLTLGLNPATREETGAGAALSVPADLALAEPFAMVSLRETYGLLGEAAFRAAGTATQLLAWAATHRYCGRCATPTERVPGERCMRCPSCGLASYPRIQPAIIVLVRRGTEALLARGARFPLPFFSTLAGFTDIGETLEETVRREIFEEVGIRVGALRYFGSQPWPFPHSLMIAFIADYESGDIKVDQDEIAEAAWFSADALPLIPPRISIARRMIDAWVEEVR